MVDKITFRIVGKNEEGDEIKKELVVQKDGKECLFVLPKGIYTYEVVLPNKEIYKKKLLHEALESEVYKKIKENFPDAELSDVEEVK